VDTAKERDKVVRRTQTGEVVSDKMQKTIVVQISSRQLHRLYKKYVTKTKRIKAHDENNEARMGDRVRIVETRPYSRDKHWRLVEIVERAK